MADLHGLTPYMQRPVDAVLLAGDLCPDAHQFARDMRPASEVHRRAQRSFFDTRLTALAVLYQAPVYAVAGNHDFGLEGDGDCDSTRIHLLHDEVATLPSGATVWGSPWTSGEHRMAFHEPDDNALAAHWDKCPAGVDIMLTHCPPYGLGDKSDVHFGSESLLSAIHERINPNLHLFGHCHEGRGAWRIGGTLHVNCTLGSHNGWQSQYEPWLLCDSSWKGDA